MIAAEPITDIDATAGETLATLQADLARRRAHAAFAELKDPVRDVLRRYGIEAAVGSERFYPTVGVAVATYLAETGTAWTDWEDRAESDGDTSPPGEFACGTVGRMIGVCARAPPGARWWSRPWW